MNKPKHTIQEGSFTNRHGSRERYLVYYRESDGSVVACVVRVDQFGNEMLSPTADQLEHDVLKAALKDIHLEDRRKGSSAAQRAACEKGVRATLDALESLINDEGDGEDLKIIERLDAFVTEALR